MDIQTKTDEQRWAEIVQRFRAEPARVGPYNVRVLGFTTCPVCLRILHAHDAREIAGGIALTCSGCHHDVISIENEDAAHED